MPRAKQQPKKVEIEPLVEKSLKSKKELKKHIEAMGGASRRERQISSTVIYEVAKTNLELVEPFTSDIVDALNRPEGQTRWEALMTLTLLIPVKGKECTKAIEAAETALFDEDSGSLRLASFTFLCELGKTTQARSREVWSLIDEAIQCFHGDVEFDDMLNALVEFSNGKLDTEVKKKFIDRMTFDAQNATGNLLAKSNEIISNLNQKKKSKTKK